MNHVFGLAKIWQKKKKKEPNCECSLIEHDTLKKEKKI